MKYKESNNIYVESCVGVSPVGEDTKLLAKHAATLNFTAAIDIGSGTGFIPIYLASLGKECSGLDINPTAIEQLERNSRHNKVVIDFYLSDLFENVQRRFDLIVFNPPLGNVCSSSVSRYIEIGKSMLPKENLFISKLATRVTERQRQALISRFLTECRQFINEKGRVLLLLQNSDLPLISRYQHKILETHRTFNFNIALVEL